MSTNIAPSLQAKNESHRRLYLIKKMPTIFDKKDANLLFYNLWKKTLCYTYLHLHLHYMLFRVI